MLKCKYMFMTTAASIALVLAGCGADSTTAIASAVAGEAEQVFTQPASDYTRRLLAAVPDVERALRRAAGDARM